MGILLDMPIRSLVSRRSRVGYIAFAPMSSRSACGRAPRGGAAALDFSTSRQ